MATDLTRIGERARQEKRCRFTSLYHHVYDLDNLRDCYEAMEKGKAPGVDDVTKEQYGEGLEEKLKDLSARLRRLGYRPKPVRRVYIPKPGTNKKRPLGIPCFEDKLVQLALVRVLQPIYEADFLAVSYGYRRGRKQHDALDELGRTLQRRKVNYIAKADIQSFFDRVNHDWMIKFLKVRVGDQRILRMIWRILKGGVLEEGLERATEQGTPQGGVLSALLSNIYLHYALDLWVERRFRQTCRGEMYFFRFADDFLACFQYRNEAAGYLRALKDRLAQFQLQVEASKTQVIEFGRFAEANRTGGKPETFDFLGFTHYCGRTRQGSFKVKRQTARKKRHLKLSEFKQWLKRERSRQSTQELLKKAKVRLQGHLNYYAITDNGSSCQVYRAQMQRILFRWLNRRSQRRSYTCHQFYQLLRWVRWPQVRIVHNLCPFRVGS